MHSVQRQRASYNARTFDFARHRRYPGRPSNATCGFHPCLWYSRTPGHYYSLTYAFNTISLSFPFSLRIRSAPVSALSSSTRQDISVSAMSRTQHDQVIDDDEEETCPLCVEEFDLMDKGFRPCPCGYQVAPKTKTDLTVKADRLSDMPILLPQRQDQHEWALPSVSATLQ